MMDSKQLAELELRMLEEHKRDKEALERLKRFLPNSDAPKPPQRISGTPSKSGQKEDQEGDEGSIRSKVTEVFAADPNRRWTIPEMVDHLMSSGFEFKAQRPQSTMFGVFHELTKRGLIRIVRRGSGRIPHTFQSTAGQREHSNSGAREESGKATLSPSSQRLINFLQLSGPLKRSDIIAKSGIPAGTVANVLTNRNLFQQRQDGRWELIEGGHQTVN